VVAASDRDVPGRDVPADRDRGRLYADAVLDALSREDMRELRAANVAALDADTLERLVVRVIAERRWPDDA
jgi:hypothetical protein